ncbi:MAG: carbonic anhydrase [Bacillota bacterium]
MNDQVKAIMKYNEAYVAQELYTQHETTKLPNRRVAILACMDTRLTVLLPQALGLKNGDAKIIKNVGGVTKNPYGSEMHGILIAIYELGAETVLIIGHDDCGGDTVEGKEIMEKMREAGITDADFEKVKSEFKAIEDWFEGFHGVEEAVRSTVKMVNDHPLVHKDIAVVGMVMNPATGQLRSV